MTPEELADELLPCEPPCPGGRHMTTCPAYWRPELFEACERVRAFTFREAAELGRKKAEWLASKNSEGTHEVHEFALTLLAHAEGEEQ